MVFEPTAAPRDRQAFLEWYLEQTRWSEDHAYDDPKVCSPALQRWFADVAQVFPPMNGPLASENCDDPHVTDHCCGRIVIYSAYVGSVERLTNRWSGRVRNKVPSPLIRGRAAQLNR
jgi:hypothetical protein